MSRIDAAVRPPKLLHRPELFARSTERSPSALLKAFSISACQCAALASRQSTISTVVP